MIYTDMTRKAMNFAYQAHQGQTDRSGVPYIFHPIHLAEQMDDEISTCAALLHDVLEDTQVTADQLRASFPGEITEIVELLTHDHRESYFDYVARVAKHPVARKIKIADLNHNTDRTRLGSGDVSEETLKRWDKKYGKARKILGIE